MSHVDEGTLHAYLDGELPVAETARLEAHLAGCAACRERLDEERALIARAGELLALAAPPAPERAAPPLHELRHPRLWWRRWARTPLAWAATVMLALATGWYLRGELRVTDRSGGGITLPSELGPVSRQTASGDEATSAPAPPAPPATAAKTRRGSAVAQGEVARDVDRLADAGVAERQKAEEAQNVAAVAADSAEAESRRDAAGVAAPPAPPAAPAAPAALPSRAEFKVANRDALAAWRPIPAADARAILGTEPVALPGVPIRGIQESPLGDGVVLVEQALDSVTVIRLFERRADREQEAAEARIAERGREYSANERLARFVGSLRVEIAGPLATDSLSKLLDRVRPIP